MKKLSIHIAEPCHEDWSNMTTAEKGRHCKSCQKDVIDFTTMHKAGIADHLLKDQGSICGRLTKDQLNVNLLPPRKNRLFLKWAALFLGMVPLAGYGQQSQSINKTEQIVMGKRIMNAIHEKPEPILFQ